MATTLLEQFTSDKKARLGAALFTGIVASLGFAPVSVGIFTGVALVAFFWLVSLAATKKETFFIGWLWGIAYFASGLSWTYHAMHDVGGIPAVLAAGGVLIMSAFYGLVPALVCLLARWPRIPKSAMLAFLLPALWTVGEWLRGDLVMGFGWLSVGYAFTNTMLSGWAPVGGVYAVSFVVVFLAGGLAAALSMGRNPTAKGLIAICFASVAIAGSWLDTLSWSKPLERLEVRVVQTALPVAMRMTREAAAERVQSTFVMGSSSPLGSHLDVVLWPESVFVASLERTPENLRLLPSALAQKLSAPVLFNAFYEPNRGRYYNEFWGALPDGRLEPLYAKRHLVPFGEFVPWGFHWFVDALGVPMADQIKGASDNLVPLALGEKSSAALTVCYENMFGGELRDWWRSGNPNLLINTANLAWFGSQVTAQFTQMSAMRSRETARPFLQALNNTGSALILPDGTMDRVVGPGAQAVDMQVMTYQGEPTPYVRFGDVPTLAAALLMALLSLLGGWWVQRHDARKP